MYNDRKKLYQQLEEKLNSKLLIYVTGDRPGMETQIHSEVLDYFADHLDTFDFNSHKNISLYLYSRGGETMAGWSIVNLIRQFCNNFEVIIPSKARSAATLISIAADKIWMTKQATLGPIDPSVNTPLNPQVPGGPPNARVPVSVEAVAAYFELAKKELKIKNQTDLVSVFIELAKHVNPIALGEVNRARTQIQMLAEKLLKLHMQNPEYRKKIISVLSSESGSHDYTINRKEAEDLHLPVRSPDTEMYGMIKAIHSDIREELQLNIKFDHNVILGNDTSKRYSFPRAIVESLSGGSHRFLTEGMLTRTKVNTNNGMIVDGINDQRTYEGWKYEN